MSIWNFIGKFFLFRWLFRLGKSNNIQENNCNNIISDIDSGFRYGWNDDYDQSLNDFHEEQDDYNMMDDF